MEEDCSQNGKQALSILILLRFGGTSPTGERLNSRSTSVSHFKGRGNWLDMRRLIFLEVTKLTSTTCCAGVEVHRSFKVEHTLKGSAQPSLKVGVRITEGFKYGRNKE